MRRSDHKPPPEASLKKAVLIEKRVAELEKQAADFHRREACWAQELDDAIRTAENQLNHTITTLQVENQQLRNQLQSVHPLVTIGIDIRRRLFAQAKSRREPGDGDVIKQGNCAAHRGRPLADAILCEQILHPRERARDAYLFLYGVYPSWALSWVYIAMVNVVLECRGSLVAEKIPLSNTFQELFNQFINHVEDCREAVVDDQLAATACSDILKEYDRIVADSSSPKMSQSMWPRSDGVPNLLVLAAARR